MKNLLNETLDKLNEQGKTWDDVKWVGGNDYTIPLANFIDVAGKTNYDGGYGASQVATDLVIVGEGWFLERYDYDGAEGWEYRVVPSKPALQRAVNKLSNESGWCTLAECQPGVDKHVW